MRARSETRRPCDHRVSPMRSSGVSVMTGATRNAISPERFLHSTKTLDNCHYLRRGTLANELSPVQRCRRAPHVAAASHC